MVPDQHVKRYMCHQGFVAALKKARHNADQILLPTDPLEATMTNNG